MGRDFLVAMLLFYSKGRRFKGRLRLWPECDGVVKKTRLKMKRRRFEHKLALGLFCDKVITPYS